MQWSAPSTLSRPACRVSEKHFRLSRLGAQRKLLFRGGWTALALQCISVNLTSL
jgi:hypothetical protein